MLLGGVKVESIRGALTIVFDGFGGVFSRAESICHVGSPLLVAVGDMRLDWGVLCRESIQLLLRPIPMMQQPLLQLQHLHLHGTCELSMSRFKLTSRVESR